MRAKTPREPRTDRLKGMREAMRVLCADDDRLWLKILEKRLPTWGYEPITVDDGETAHRALCAEDGPSIALVDWMMPGMSGVEVCRAVRNQGPTRYVYVILVTGRGETEDLIEGLTAGADDYIVKPVSPSELERRLFCGRRVIELERSLVDSRVALEREMLECERTSAELRQAQKLEAIAQLAAGIAHEINTPVQFIGDSVDFLAECLEHTSQALSEYRRFAELMAESGEHSQAVEALAAVEEQLDLAYLLDEGPQAVARTTTGVARVSEIVQAMRGFAPATHRARQPSDLNKALLDTLIVARGEYKYVADAETDLDNLPPVHCLAADLSQVFVNLVVNAAHAMREAVRSGQCERGLLRVRSRVADEDTVLIEIEDNGSGIPEHVVARVFDPFFTTKAVGEGTGQGLALAHRVVTQAHGGEIRVRTRLGEGTTFAITLPIFGVDNCSDLAA